MAAAGSDAFVVTHLPNLFYLSGFSGSSAVLLISESEVMLFTDQRYTIQAREETAGILVQITSGALLASVGKQISRRRFRKVGIDGANLTLEQMSILQRSAGRRVRWVRTDGKIEEARSIKDGNEVKTIREAADIACSAWEEILPLVKPGVREIDLAADLEYRFKRKGAAGPAFDTIVASGERSALPHARASCKTIRKNELVVFDLGAILRGYSSDLTRTVFVGRAPAKVRKWYHAVLEAQVAAREAISPGVAAEDVDAAARRVLRRAGLAAKFTHSTGHGLGLEVHERPRLGHGNRAKVRSGMVVTVEPGVYMEGEGGIRIEDDVLVTQTGAELLTRANRELIEIG